MEITVLHSTESLFLFVILFYFYCDRKESEEEEIIMLRLTYSSTQVNLKAQTKINHLHDKTERERVELNELFTLVCVYFFSIYRFDLANTHN